MQRSLRCERRAKCDRLRYSKDAPVGIKCSSRGARKSHTFPLILAITKPGEIFRAPLRLLHPFVLMQRCHVRLLTGTATSLANALFSPSSPPSPLPVPSSRWSSRKSAKISYIRKMHLYAQATVRFTAPRKQWWGSGGGGANGTNNF